MAKKSIATLQTGENKSYSKVIKMVKSKKTNNYSFKEEMVPKEEIENFFKK